MTIQQYIDKYSLTLWKKYPRAASGVFDGGWTPSLFLMKGDEKSPNDQYEILANDEKTRFVSKNITKNMFKIVHSEMVVIESEWLPMQTNFSVQAMS